MTDEHRAPSVTYTHHFGPEIREAIENHLKEHAAELRRCCKDETTLSATTVTWAKESFLIPEHMPVLVLTCKQCGRINTFAARAIDERWAEGICAQAEIGDQESGL